MLCVLQAVVHCVQLLTHRWKLGEIGLGDHMIIGILLPRKVIACEHSLAFSNLRASYSLRGLWRVNILLALFLGAETQLQMNANVLQCLLDV